MIIGPFRTYQFLLIIATIIVIIYFYRRLRVKKITPATFVLWVLVCIVVNFFAFAPRFSDPLAGFFGFGRGLDLLLVLGYALLVYAIFRLYVKIDELNRNTTELVRALAIKDEVKLEDIDKEEE
ncbi:MAG: DUF2304 family protein [Methanobrevibacter sp.]|nr:DUF2304 family protein [Methanobrevibacter sp.]MBO7159043.1 DUF2304 family protein [Methanobrevibacter sp.]MBO7209618.1 DUF2304 family protein [Methanobrevibacter sp.]MBO7734106.1 DUF2304 family protein [Methanobrevibacter sp.]